MNTAALIYYYQSLKGRASGYTLHSTGKLYRERKEGGKGIIKSEGKVSKREKRKNGVGGTGRDNLLSR
jgi:hypothetical protein